MAPERTDGFGGALVVAFENRMAAETAALIERFGGRPLVAPAMSEAPLENNPAAFDFADSLTKGAFDTVIFLTGVGARTLFAAIASRYPGDTIAAALARITTVVRGPKPVTALREIGVEPTLAIDEPNTWREILHALDQRGPLVGARIAVQEYGVTNRDLIAGLEARGAQVVSVPVYRWTLPADRRPLQAAITAIGEGRAGAVLFTSSAQATNVVRVAEAAGNAEQLRRGLAATVVGSIGPVCSEHLRALQIHFDLEPSHPKLGHLVKAAAAVCARNRARALNVPLTIADTTPVASQPSPLHEHPFLRACRRQPVPFTPIWLMRQAGRYMPEYRRVRGQHPFLDLCRRPELAAEVTVTAVERLGVDAAIIFADILLPLLPLGVGLRYESGDGPIIERPVRTPADLERLPSVDVESLSFVADAIRLVDRAIGNRTPIIGFAGAPFTLASYLIEGGSSRQYQATKTLAYNEPATWDRLMTLLAQLTAAYLRMQIKAGAHAVQLFDSWVGSLGPDDYRRLVLPYTQQVIAAVRGLVPVIHFGTITGNLLELMRAAGGDVIGLDWRVDLGEAWQRLGYDVAVQGNLDPIALFAERDELRRQARLVLDRAAGRSGHIFNLGHGILPETPVDHVIALVDAVHELSAR